MKSEGVLIFGCSDASAKTGLEADQRAIAALDVPAATVSTGSITKSAETHVAKVSEPASTLFETQIEDATRKLDCKVVKIGAIVSEAQIKAISELLPQNGAGRMSVIDVEAFFKSGTSGSKPDVVAVLRRDVLPSITLLSATVPGIMHLLEDAGIPAGYPRGIPDVQALATTVAQALGPQYVIIKREFIDEEDGATTLHYVLAGRGANAQPPVMETFRVANPRRVFGASYAIPPAIAAYLVKGYSVPEAVFAGFEFIGEKLKAGELFE